MFRQPLSYFFPSIFPSSSATKSKDSGSGKGYRYGGSGKNDWIPPSVDKDGDIRLRDVVVDRDRGSEEYILKGDGRVVRDGVGGRRKEMAIEKTVGYSVYSEGRKEGERY